MKLTQEIVFQNDNTKLHTSIHINYKLWDKLGTSHSFSIFIISDIFNIFQTFSKIASIIQ